MKLIFLDIDGVLNDHKPFANGYSGINYGAVEKLNQIIEATGAQIVLSSAWRYMCFQGDIYPAALTLKGVEYLLKIHGATNELEVVGLTERDCHLRKGSNRGHQIHVFLKQFNRSGELHYEGHWVPPVYLVIDDNAFDIAECGHPFVQTDGDVGLMDADVAKAIEILGSKR